MDCFRIDTILKPAFSISARMAPAYPFFTASGLIMLKVRCATLTTPEIDLGPSTLYRPASRQPTVESARLSPCPAFRPALFSLLLLPPHPLTLRIKRHPRRQVANCAS